MSKGELATVLVVFEEIPEKTNLFVLHVDQDTLKEMTKWHHHFINSTETSEEIQKAILKFFYKEDGRFKLKPKVRPLKNATFDLVIVTGFIL